MLSIHPSSCQSARLWLRSSPWCWRAGRATRLYPLTEERAKPAVPFGGKYRIIDFVLSNLINSGLHSIYVVVQFAASRSCRHVRRWKLPDSRAGLKARSSCPSAADRAKQDWYRATADAVHQNVNLIEQSAPNVVAVFGGDHIYRMNMRDMIEFHLIGGAHGRSRQSRWRMPRRLASFGPPRPSHRGIP
ncbi:MAG: hypothetical protein IPO99_18110 [Nitrospira sp.]|nr:hypothetical protein [Nitrospira sp.]